MTIAELSVSAASQSREHADWLELKALASDDGNSSLQDLIAELRRNGSTDAIEESTGASADAHGELTERIAGDAFSEIEERALAAGPGYPFHVGTRSIQALSSVDDRSSTYLFLLLLSVYGVRAVTVGVRPERDFEDISQFAAQGYFGLNEHDGHYLFAFPRRTKAPGFAQAVEDLSSQLGEGVGAKDVTPSAQQKDAHLDVVVWHGFPDRRPGQLIAFGQCAAGGNWRTKVTELGDCGDWCRAWMIEPPAVDPMRMLFIPHRLGYDEWATRAILGGVLFERCRIAYYAPAIPASVMSRCAKWSDAVINQLVRR